MCEAWCKEHVKSVCGLFWGDDYVLRPGTQHNPGIDPTHYLNHTASRLTTGPIIDMFMAAAAVASEMGASDHAVRALQSLGAVTNGLLGVLRGRVISHVNSEVSVDEDGTKEPAGLCTGIAEAVRYGARKSWNALGPMRRPGSLSGTSKGATRGTNAGVRRRTGEA